MPPSLASSPRIFNGLLQKSLSDLITSNLDTTKSPSIHSEPEPIRPSIGLALIDSLDEDDDSVSKPVSRMSLFGSKLNVQIPTPSDFGIKTKNHNSSQGTTPLKEFSRQLSLKEMELSEDYTCVITHGPRPKTTHIFDNCVVECCDSSTNSVDFRGSCKGDLLHVCSGERKPYSSMINAEREF